MSRPFREGPRVPTSTADSPTSSKTATPTSFTYQWKRAGTPIPGEDASTHTVVAADESHDLTVTVTAVNSAGSVTATSAPSFVPPASAPANTGIPVVSGKAVVGDVLDTTNGTWTGSPTKYLYQWCRAGAVLSGATGTTYTLQPSDAGSRITSTVTASNSAGAAAASSTSTAEVSGVAAPNPSGQAMPTTSPTGWRIVFSDDFMTPAVLGAFYSNSAYTAKWGYYPVGYKDTTGAGSYTPARTGVVTPSVLQLGLSTTGTTINTAAALPILHEDGNYDHGQTYGRYDVCLRTDDLPGFKIAFLLWPDDNNDVEGEIDFPETDLDGFIAGHTHNTTGDHAENAFSVTTMDSPTDWHVCTIEWLPAGVTFIIDGKEIGYSPASQNGTPSTSFHVVYQCETAIDGTGPPAPEVAGNVYIDWVVIYAPA